MSKKLVDLRCYRDASGHDVEIRPDGTRKVTLSFEGDPGLTEQHPAGQLSIEYLLAKHCAGGQTLTIPESEFMDLTNIPDYQTCLMAVQNINTLFHSLPLKVRSAFGEDPSLFMDAVEDPSQRDRLIELGVFKPMDGALKGNPDPDIKVPLSDTSEASGSTKSK